MFHIGNREIGDGAPCFITFEIGPTHNGVESAKRLIKHAAEAGADAVKFQVLDPDRLVADKNQMFSYGVLKDRESGEMEIIEEPLYDILKRRYLEASEWKEVKAYTDKLGIAFFSTVAFNEEVDLMEELNCHSIKIASADVNHVPLLRRVAKTGMCIQLDTGMSTLGEVEEAVDIIRREGNENIIIHQCPSGYPAHMESINLNIIPTLKRMFPFPIAFSDHSPGSSMDIAAVALGANMVEKTITEDRMTRSVEHIMSIEPPEMMSFVQVIRDIEVSLGGSRRVLHDEEKKNRDSVRRSIYLKVDLSAGHILNETDFEYKRPGFGIQPSHIDILIGKTLRNSKKRGELLEWKDVE